MRRQYYSINIEKLGKKKLGYSAELFIAMLTHVLRRLN
jgi:hypothetical protein